MKRTYNFKGFYKILSFVALLLMIVALILNALLGEVMAIVLVLGVVVTFLQYRRYSNPYIEIDAEEILVRSTAFASTRVALNKIVQIEANKRQFVLHLDSGKSVLVFLGFMAKEAAERASEDIPALVGDWSQHLTAE